MARVVLASSRSSRGRRAAAAAAVAVLVVLAVGVPAAPARAHAIVASTEPAIDEVVPTSPPQVLMRFNEPVELAFGAIRVFDSSGRRVDRGDAAYVPGRPDEVRVGLQPDLPDGTYTVSWRIISADSHPIGEAHVFHVGAPGVNPEGIGDQLLAGDAGAGRTEAFLLGVTRWVSFSAQLLLIGALLFFALVWGRPKGGFARPADVERRFDDRWRRLLRWSWATLAVVTILALWLQAAVAAGVPAFAALSPVILAEVMRTRFGMVSVVKLIVLVLGAAGWLLARHRVTVGRGAPAPASVGAGALTPTAPRPLVAAGLIFTAALALTPGLAGHAGTTPPVALNLVTDAGHVLAAAMWLGGLVVLIRVAFPASRELEPGDRVRLLAPVVSRFSDLALVSVALLVVTGIYRGWVEVRSLEALFGESYGVVLLVKLGVFVPLLALGAVNNRWTMPRIDAAAAAETPDEAPLSRLRRLVGVEVAIGTVVLAVTAVLVNLPPARVMAAAEGQAMQEIRLGEHAVGVMVRPNRVGENTVELMVGGMAGMTDAGGSAGASEAGASEAMSEAGAQETEAPMSDHGDATEGAAAEGDAVFDDVTVNFSMPAQNIGPLVADAEQTEPGHWVVTGRQLSVPGTWTLEIVATVDRFSQERATVELTVPR